LKDGNRLIIIFLILLLFLILNSSLNHDMSLVHAQEVIEEKAEIFDLSKVIVISIIFITLVLFIKEPLPVGVIALLIPFVLVILNKWTNISTQQALSGFSNEATITVMAMFVISKGIQNSGSMQLLGQKIEQITGKNEKKQMVIISSIAGGIAGFINNTPVVAALVPMVTNLARRTTVSPSKLMIPLSYASMLGGTITLLGTSTNILASDISERLINHPFGMFEFSKLGLIVFIAGIFYLITVGYYLLPKRIIFKDDILLEYKMNDHLFIIQVNKGCKLIHKNIEDIYKEFKNIDFNVIEIIRNDENFIEHIENKTIREGDKIVLRVDSNYLEELLKIKGLKILFNNEISQEALQLDGENQEIIELIIPDKSFLESKTLKEANFIERYNCNILAIRHGREVIHNNLENYRLQSGEILLLLVSGKTLNRLKENDNFIIGEKEYELPHYSKTKIIISLLIIMGVVLTATFNILSIAIATLGGVVAMVITDVVKPEEVFNSINWEVYFLLAGLIPLGLAVEQSGTAQYLAKEILSLTGALPPIVTLGIFYYFTSLITDLISNNASVVLMIPIAVGVANQIGANPFSFILAVTFAASASFASPIGYQTNLMVYGPGGYNFKDYIIVGAPLELFLAVIVPIFIKIFWGI